MARETDYSRMVADKIIEHLKEGTAPWQKEWEPGNERALPYNPTTDKDYRGMNSMWLMMQGYSDTRWMTYKQAASVGAQVRKSAKGTAIQYWQFEGREPVKDERGRPVKDAEGKAVTRPVRYERPRVFTASVFNAEQIDGLPPAERRAVPNEWDRHQAAEQVLSNSRADIHFRRGDQAFYTPALDSIVLPERDQFRSADGFYATALHELGHWTGHSSRLDRDLSHPFGSEGYAREELRAEISSLMVGDRLGIGHDPKRHAAYVGSWIKALEKDPREIFRAAADAEKITDLVMSFRQEREQTPAQVFDHPLAYVLDDTERHYFGHYTVQPSVAEAMEAAGLATIGDVIGHDSRDYGAMHETAIERLSPVFGIPVDYHGMDNPYLERKGLAGAFAEAGERILALEKGQKAEQEPAPAEQPVTETQTMEIRAPILTDPSEVAMKTSDDRTYLAVPYTEKNDAKALGAKWDRDAKAWFVPPGADLEPFARWSPDHSTVASEPDLDPRQEFKAALQDAGLIINGLPQMDGQLVRVAVQGDQGKERSGSYIGYADGRPAGHITNFRQGIDEPWKAQNWAQKALNAQERAQQAAAQAARLAQRDRERERTAEAVAHQAEQHWEKAEEATADHPYLKRKGVEAYGVRVDRAGGVMVPADAEPNEQQSFSRNGNLLVPMQDVDGKLWGLQTIAPSGFKGMMKGSHYAGTFHLLGDLAGDGAIMIGEGYATGADLHRETNLPFAVAFSSNNLEAVATAIRGRYPDRPIIIAGDNDHRKPLELDGQGRPKKNVGREKTEEAANAVGGYPMLPSFDADDHGTDWNDLRVDKGQEAFKKQVFAGLASAQRHQLARASRLTAEPDQAQEQEQQRQQKRERLGVRYEEPELVQQPRRARSR